MAAPHRTLGPPGRQVGALGPGLAGDRHHLMLSPATLLATFLPWLAPLVRPPVQQWPTTPSCQSWADRLELQLTLAFVPPPGSTTAIKAIAMPCRTTTPPPARPLACEGCASSFLPVLGKASGSPEGMNRGALDGHDNCKKERLQEATLMDSTRTKKSCNYSSKPQASITYLFASFLQPPTPSPKNK